jgi:tetratricopeptide (TPR) repeat protein
MIAMKIGKFVYILVILVVIAGFVLPVAAVENETADAGTSYYNAGIRLLGSNEYQRAIDLFDKALASDTTMIRQSDALLYTYQGKSYALVKLEKYDEAIKTVDEGLAIYPGDFMLWNNKGYSFFKLGNNTEALKSYDMALSFDQNYTISLINKGDTLYKMGRFQNAADTYSKANVTDPGNKLAMDGLEKARNATITATPPITSLPQTMVPTTLPTKTQSPLSLLPIVTALSIMGLLSIILMKKR